MLPNLTRCFERLTTFHYAQSSAIRRRSETARKRLSWPALVGKGYFVSIPFGENHRYDLLVDDGGRILRVQVKTGRLRRDVIEYSCSSSHTHRGGTHARPYFGQADVIAVYCPQNGKVYLVPEEEFVASRAHLRLTAPANNQRRGIRWASRFELA
jgi:hypothetical protein